MLDQNLRGEDAIRTRNLLSAKQPLYHWSYIPIVTGISGVVELRGYDPRTSALPARRSTD